MQFVEFEIINCLFMTHKYGLAPGSIKYRLCSAKIFLMDKSLRVSAL